MADRRNHQNEPRPLSSGELEQDRLQAGQDGDLGEQLASDDSKQSSNRDEDARERGPDPIAGTMLPPD